MHYDIGAKHYGMNAFAMSEQMDRRRTGITHDYVCPICHQRPGRGRWVSISGQLRAGQRMVGAREDAAGVHEGRVIARQKEKSWPKHAGRHATGRRRTPLPIPTPYLKFAPKTKTKFVGWSSVCLRLHLFELGIC